VPSIQSGNHGKFSIVVVVVNCHQAATHQAINHSNIRGFKFALAAYIAAVCHAGQDQIIIIFSIKNIETLKYFYCGVILY
jgi:hypothetical protein